MRVKGPDFGPDYDEYQHGSLAVLVREIGDAKGRLCQACDVPCACSGSLSCTCGCAPDCEHASKMMTSDPKFPIESLIAPLVFAFQELRLCPPCWSCEGHMTPGGELQRPPTVWFYARSQAFLGLIDDYVVSLWAKKLLNVPWRVSIAYTDLQQNAPAFALQPDLANIARPNLEAMQRDIGIIAQGLKAGVTERADKLVANIDQYISDHSKP